jgi:hypothetical protein
VTGTDDEDAARHLLEALGWDLDAAISMHIDAPDGHHGGGGGGGGGGGAGMGASSSGAGAGAGAGHPLAGLLSQVRLSISRPLSRPLSTPT